jgi:hypothetical protein
MFTAGSIPCHSSRIPAVLESSLPGVGVSIGTLVKGTHVKKATMCGAARRRGFRGMVLRDAFDVGDADRTQHIGRLRTAGGAARPDEHAVRVGNFVLRRARFQLLFGPASVHPYRMAWPTTADPPGTPHPADWYGWRLMGANNREVGRNAMSFLSYPLARHAVGRLQHHADRLVQRTTVDPVTGRWSWLLELDGDPVVVSGRWYERDHDSRQGSAKFIALLPTASLTDGVVTLRDRRGSAPRLAIEGTP